MDSNEELKMESPVEAHATDNRGYIARLFAGDVQLVVTYWVWGVLVGGLGFTLTNAILEANYMQLVAMPYGVFLINSFYFVMLAFSIFVWIAIWRSAGKYQGAGWGVAARVVIVLNVLAVTGSLMLNIEDGELSDSVYAEQTRLINNSLPMMIDKGTRLESATITRTEYRYRNTMIDWTAADVDKYQFSLRMRFTLAENLCKNMETRAALNSGVTFIYTYNDSVGDHIADVSLTVDNCP